MTTEAEYVEKRKQVLGPMLGLSDAELKQSVSDRYSRLHAILDLFQPEQAIWKPNKEEWSAAQVGDHVVLGTGVLGKIISLLARGQTVTDEDWDPPPQFRGDASDVKDVSKRLTELPAQANLIFDEAARTDRLDVTANNSFFGDLNWREWYCYLGVHAQAHTEQIEKLRSMEGFPG
jgi:hypothetical protein